ncbi:hypothetical protein ACWOFR_15725 [Carnobacterium gallinarum]|uniref:hypothetical protein n=1 Tax=Carnobacterium gallinarum TaxID=2749 RepID=UPI00054F2DD7|nr:hypothetical protein [Carnobacterium gallinarum]
MKSFVVDINKKDIDKISIGEVAKPIAKKREALIKVMAVPLSSWELDFAKEEVFAIANYKTTFESLVGKE